MMQLSLVDALALYSAGTPHHTLPEYAGLKLTSLYSPHMEADGALQLLRLELAPGQAVPLHVNDRSEGIYLLQGRVRFRRDAGQVELDAPSGAYLPAGCLHAMENVGREFAVLLITFSRKGRSALSESRMINPAEVDFSALPNPNQIIGAEPLFRWAVHESYERWGPVEPSKGWRQKMKYLFDPDRGAPDFVSGLAVITRGTHYTLHHHEPAEFYYVLDGEGIIYVGNQAYQVKPGDTVHVPANVTHGIDATASDMLMHWIYAVEGLGANWTWTADEPIYSDIQI